MLARADTCFEFGPLRLVPSRRALYADGRPVAIHGRALDLLAVLVEHRDRVVGRDELLARVWAGSTVSDNNIAVQVAALRRVLSAHGVDPQAIVNVSGRGYQFVGELTERAEFAPADMLPSLAPQMPAASMPADATSGDPRAFWRRRRTSVIAALAMLGLVAIAAIRLVSAGGGQADDLRLTIGFRPLDAIGPAPAVALATAYTNAIRTRRRWMEDFRVYAADRAPNGRSFHFYLSGSVQVIADGALLSYTLVTADGELVHGDTDTVPLAPTRDGLFREAGAIFREIAPDLFRAEAARRRGPPRDATDFVVAAQVTCSEYDRYDRFDAAVALAERADALAPRSVAARLLLAGLLVDRLSVRPAQEGDADGTRALGLYDDVLDDEPRNAGALQGKASDLVELGEPSEAEKVALLGLVYDPDNPVLLSTLLDAYEEDAKFPEADALVAARHMAPENPNLAQLAFAEGHDHASIDLIDHYLAVASVDLQRRLMTLLKVASLVRLGLLDQATPVLHDVLDGLPMPFRTVAGLRRAYYELPPPAWSAFTSALERAGMKPDAGPH